jgi:hypothetical protein
MDRSAAATHLPGHRRKRSGCRLDPASLELSTTLQEIAIA